MKSSGFALRFLTVVGAGLVWASLVHAQAPAAESFPGVKKALTPEQYASSGLNKLSPEEQAKLDDFLKGYFAGASQRVAEQAASQAVDQAVKEKKVQPATFIESRLVGTFIGWGPRTVFVLDNGQRWKPIGDDKASFAPVENAQVFILRDAFGYKMAILGGSTLRVRRLS